MGLGVRVSGYVLFLVCVLLNCVSPSAADKEVSAEEWAVFDNYLDTVKFRFFFRDGSAAEPLLRDAALKAAAKYAAGSDARLTENVEEAGVSIEIDALTEGESRGDNHYGAAAVSCTLYENLTGRRLQVLQNPAPRTFSKASQFDAQANAVDSALSRLVPEAVRQARNSMRDLYGRGHTDAGGVLFLNAVTNRILNPKK